MPQPPRFNRSYNFTEYAATHTAAPYNPAQHDKEHDDVKASLDAILDNLVKIQRDDGKLVNSSVHVDALSKAVLGLMGQWNARGAWATATEYKARDVVSPTAGSSTAYVCVADHTSAAAFATDLATGKWLIVAGDGSVTASTVSMSAFDDIASINVQSGLTEIAAKRARLAGDEAQAFKVAAASVAEHAARAGDLRVNRYARIGTVTGTTLLAATLEGFEADTLETGMILTGVAASANTNACTLNLTSGGNTFSGPVVKYAANVLTAGDIQAGQIIHLVVVMNAGNPIFHLINPNPPTSTTVIPIGSRMIFQQPTAPTGWLKEANPAFNDAALRIVTGNAVPGGGVDAFSTVFGTSRQTSPYTLTVADIPSHQHTITDPGHTHSFSGTSSTAFAKAGPTGSPAWSTAAVDTPGFAESTVSVSGTTGSSTATPASTNVIGGNGAHSHVIANMNLKFIDFIIATKQ